MTVHGTYSAYTNGGCHCRLCTDANRDYKRGNRRRWHADLTPEQRKRCLVCGTALNIHPIRACWREVR